MNYSTARKLAPVFEIRTRTRMKDLPEQNRFVAAPVSDGEFAQALENEAVRVNHAGGQLGLILFGLDRLGDIYQHLGRDGGDELLDHLSTHLARRIRTHDLFARLTEGEFGLLTTGMELSEVTGCAVKLRHLVSDFHFNRVGRIHASFGVTHFLRGEPVAMLEERARRALARSRAAGGNRVSAFRAPT